jgi:hypothetical protein
VVGELERGDFSEKAVLELAYRNYLDSANGGGASPTPEQAA